MISGLGKRSDPVRLTPGLSYEGLQLTAQEGYVLSRIEGASSLGDLILTAGLPEPQAIAVLKSLKSKGILRGPGEAAPTLESVEAVTGADRARYDGFIFDPAAMGEDVVLDEDAKKELLFLDAHLADMHHYDFLGVRPKTPDDEIRAAYLQLTRKFHPDRYYGKELGSFKERLSRVFQRIKEAHDTLTDEEAREEYDMVTEVAATSEELDVLAKDQERVLRDERRKKERRDRLRKRSPIVSKRAKVGELQREAAKAAQKGDHRQAANLYQMALSHDPGNPELEALRDEERAAGASEKAEELLHRAGSEEVMGEPDRAMALRREALEADPDNMELILMIVAFLSVKGGKEEEVLALTRRATKLGRYDAQAWTAHGHAHRAAGDKKMAKKAYETAIDIDQGSDDARAALKKMKWTLF